MAERLEELRVAPVLAGYRGGAAVSMTHLLDTIETVIQIAASDPSTIELEINPLFLQDDEACAVDALIVRVSPPD